MGQGRYGPRYPLIIVKQPGNHRDKYQFASYHILYVEVLVDLI